MKHTKGPWVIWALSNGSDGIADKNDRVIATSMSKDVSEQSANARLISAAPDLLQALKDLHREIWAHHKMNVKRDVWLLKADAAAIKAIHKAENEGRD